MAQRSSGGGVLAAFSNGVQVTCLSNIPVLNFNPLMDTVICRCRLNNDNVYIVNVYIPPAVSPEDYDLYLEALTFDLLGKKLIICGDFNCPEFASVTRDNDRKYIALLSFMNILNLKQYNSVRNQNNRLLDLVFSNINCSVEILRHSDPLVNEDGHHPALDINFEICATSETNKFPSNSNQRYNFRRANFPTLYNDLTTIDWSYLENYTDVNEAISAFYDAIYDVVKRSVPILKSPKRTYPPWYNSEIINCIKLKDYYLRKWHQHKINSHLEDFRRLRKQVKTLTNRAYLEYQITIENSIVNDPKLFWQFINSKRKSSRIPGCLAADGHVIENPVDIVEAFAEQFSQVNQSPTIVASNKRNGALSCSCYSIGPVSCTDVYASIKKLKSNMTAGHDGLPAFLIRDCSPIFAGPLATIYNLIIGSCTFPDYWKMGRITPVYKSGDHCDIRTYRPITLLSNFAKVFEHLLHSRLFQNIKSQLSNNQHGFFPGRSTITNLVEVTQYISDCLDRRRQVDVIYTDFSKAFDTVNHSLLIHKLDDLGFSGEVTDLMRSYFDSRFCYVHYNGFTSSSFKITSGVPQGSILGPLLFNIYINDLFPLLDCNTLAYADDLKIYQEITSISDCIRLQNNINLISTWCTENEIQLNLQKCSVMTYSRIKKPYIFDYYANQSLMPRQALVKDLGVLFDSRLTFADHIIAIRNSACRSYGFLVRSSKTFTNLAALKTLYCALVRSKLEYASVVWHPHYTYQQLTLERVQKQFLKFLSFKIDNTYPNRGTDYKSLLARHNFCSLETRRTGASGLFLVKLVRGVVDAPSLLSNVNFIVPQYGTRSSDTFVTSRARTNVLYKAPLAHMARNANVLYDDPFFC